MTVFETTGCTRCGGCGRYSWCQMYGDTCFKCHGTGKVYTARGRVAVNWWHAQRSIQAKDVQVGMTITGSGWKRLKVTAVKMADKSAGKSLQPDGTWKDHPPNLIISGNGGGLYTFPDAMVEILPHTKEEAARQVAAALAFQATLTKVGKPRKVQK